MSKNEKETIPDPIVIELTPEHPDACLGNGEQSFECCYDECDYYLLRSQKC